MKIAILEDRQEDTSTLLNFLETYCDEKKVGANFYTFNTEYEFFSQIESEIFDLVFLDVYLNGANGMDIAKTLRKNGFEGLIVFSTVSTDYAVSGYSVQAFDYLVKPFGYDCFKESMDRCIHQLSHKQLYISVKESRTYVKILLDDIIYTDYHNHYIQIHTEKRVIKSYMRFADFFSLLEPYPQFLNCYRNCVVNLDYVAGMKGYEFLLTNGDIMPVTRNQRTVIKQAYADYEFLRMKKGVK